MEHVISVDSYESKTSCIRPACQQNAVVFFFSEISAQRFCAVNHDRTQELGGKRKLYYFTEEFILHNLFVLLAELGYLLV
jgi:hypothetical protein